MSEEDGGWEVAGGCVFALLLMLVIPAAIWVAWDDCEMRKGWLEPKADAGVRP